MGTERGTGWTFGTGCAVVIAGGAVLLLGAGWALVSSAPHVELAPGTPTLAERPMGAAPAAVAQTRVVTDEVHGANFRGDELDECVDIVVTYDVSSSQDWTPAHPVSEFWRANDTTPIARPCQQQFTDRQILATCIVPLVPVIASARREETSTKVRRGGSQAQSATPVEPLTIDRVFGPEARSATISSTYYRFPSVFESDGYMRDCLSVGGDWQAVSHDSDAYRDARLAYHMRKLQGVGDTAQRMLDRMPTQ